MVPRQTVRARGFLFLLVGAGNRGRFLLQHKLTGLPSTHYSQDTNLLILVFLKSTNMVEIKEPYRRSAKQRNGVLQQADINCTHLHLRDITCASLI